MPHIHEKIDFTASAYVVYKNKVLLRKHDKYHMWLDAGGHIEPDEDPNEAVVREVKEEVGLDIKLVGSVPTIKNTPFEGERELVPPRFLNRHRIGETHEHVDLVYFATANTDAIAQGVGETSSEIRWFTKEELLDPEFGINERVQHYALEALKIAADQS